MLPLKLVEPLQRQLEAARLIHCLDLREGYEEAHLPCAPSRKYPRAGLELGWQYVFPSKNRSTGPDDGGGTISTNQACSEQ